MAKLNIVKRFRGTTKTPDGNLMCGHCGAKIQPGDGYRWWSNRLPGRGSGSKQVRCMQDSCTPTLADRTPGRRGQLMQIQMGANRDLENATDFDAVKDAAQTAAVELRSMGYELIEGADNIESGFGHETEQSNDMRERGEALIEIADYLETMDSGEEPEREECESDAEYMDRYDEAMGKFRDEVDEKIQEVEV
jgi:hypothetical protein